MSDSSNLNFCSNYTICVRAGDHYDLTLIRKFASITILDIEVSAIGRPLIGGNQGLGRQNATQESAGGLVATYITVPLQCIETVAYQDHFQQHLHRQ